MTAEDLLTILEQRQLVSAGILASLRKQVAGAARPIPPASVIKLLVDKQQLTHGQAEQLLRSAADKPAAAPAGNKPVAPAATKSTIAPTAGKAAAPASLDDELGLAPLEPSEPVAAQKTAPVKAVAVKPATSPVKPASQPASSTSLEDELGLAPLEPTEPAAPSKTAAVKPVAVKPATSPVKAVSQPASSTSLEDELGLAPLEPTEPAAPSKTTAVKPVAVKPVAVKPVAAKPAASPVKAVSQPASTTSLEDELGLAPLESAAPAAVQKTPAQKVSTPSAPAQKVAVATAKAAPVKPRQPALTSLEDEPGLSSDSDGPANQPAAQRPAANSKPGTTAGNPAAAKAVTAKAATAKPATAKPTSAQPKAAAATKVAPAPDLGLDDDLYSDLGAGAGLFDEGLLSTAGDEHSAGPLDMPADDPLGSAAAAATAVAPAATHAVRPKRWKKVLAIFASAVGVLLLAAGIAAAVLLRPTGDPEFQAAEKDYKAEAWAAAAGKYGELLRNYPSQTHAGAARVHRGLAQLRAELSEHPQWQRVLETAEKVLPEIESEPEFSELHADLAVILPDLADALTRSADETDDPAEVERRVAQGRRALALATDSRYVPPADRPWQRLQAIDDRLAVLGREVDRPRELKKTVADIRQAIAKPGPAADFALREKLVERFPELAGNESLQAALVELTAAEKGLVKPSGEKSQPAVREERKTPVKGWTSLIARRVAAAAGDSGAPALVAVDGALYAFDSASGKVLWRRFIGNAPAASAVLVASEDGAAQDALLVDDRFHDLLRVDAVSGRIKWRQTLDKSLTGPPAIASTVAFAATRAATMHRVDLKTGELTHSITLPSLPVGSPTASADGKHVYQLTARGELFALAAGDLSCAGVLYLGLEFGGLAYPPSVAGRYVVVVDDYGLHESALRVVALDAAGLPAEVVSVVPIAGRIAAAPTVIGNHLIVVNERGTAVALEMTGNRDKPFKKASEAEGESSSAQWFPVASGTHLWVAGTGWRGFDLQKGRLTPRGKPVTGETFDSSPSVVGKSIVGTYRRPGQRGAVVFAGSLAGARLWEVEIGRIAEDAATDADALASLGLAIVDGDGHETQIDLKQPSGWHALEPFADGIRLANQKWLWWRGTSGHASILFDPKHAPAGATLPAEVVALPAALARGLLMPVADGALLLIDPASGKSLATPLRPYVIGGETARWTAPALSAKGTEVLIADDHPTLYEVAVQKDPQPQLVKVSGAELDAPVVAGPVVAGTAAYIVTRDGMLRAFAVPGLKPAGEWKLTSRFVPWMRAAGDVVLLASGDELIGCSAGRKVFWKSPLGAGPPCGNPLMTEGGIWLAESDGHVVRLDAATGKESAKIDLGQPLIGGPTKSDSVVTAMSADGCLLEFSIK